MSAERKKDAVKGFPDLEEGQAPLPGNMPWNRKTCLYWKCSLREGILTPLAAPSRHAAHQRKALS